MFIHEDARQWRGHKKYTLTHYVNYPHMYNKEASEEIDLITLSFFTENIQKIMALKNITNGCFKIKNINY